MGEIHVNLYCRPEMVEKALKKMTEEFIEFDIFFSETTNIKKLRLVEERADDFFYPLNVFEQF